MISESVAEKKAELIKVGAINIAKGFALPHYPSRSSAGPGAGKRALVFCFHGTRVKLSIVRDGSSIFTLLKRKDSDQESNKGQPENEPYSPRCLTGEPYMILKNDDIFIDRVSLEPTIMHAPRQAFINITSNCIYNCSFCVSPSLDKDKKECSIERWIELILAQANNPGLEAVAITSGVLESPHKTVLDMVKIIKGVREELPEIPIGVEPYITSNDDIDLLHKAGANELKINLETPNPNIFDKVCPGMEYDGIKAALEYGALVFGRNKVCSNLIIGLGETDAQLEAAIEYLAKLGIVATLRAVRINDINGPQLEAALGFTPKPVEPERLLALARKQKVILERYQLSTELFQTMCHRCKSCDIVPQQDV